MPELTMRWPVENLEQPVQRYFLAIFAAGAALYLRSLLSPFYGDHYPYQPLFLAVMFSAWFCGVGPAIVATILATLGAWYWFLPPEYSWTLKEPKTELAGVLGFVFFSSLIIAMGEGNRRVRSRLKRSLQEIEVAQAELETQIHERTAEVNAATHSLRELSGRLLQIRDEEQRRVARELHDGAGQVIAAIAMDLGALTREAEKLSPKGIAKFSEIRELVEGLGKEIRTISHLLHPPMLEEVGLISAVRWYVEEFRERSKIRVELELGDLDRLTSEIEIAIFRIIQECLTNVHRHSGSSWALIRIIPENEKLLIEVRDSGKGISIDRNPELSAGGRSGLGLRGMRERVRQLKGTLTINSGDEGTKILAILPMQKPAADEDGYREAARSENK
jgi:signal transduction histidine kinase